MKKIALRILTILLYMIGGFFVFGGMIVMTENKNYEAIIIMIFLFGGGPIAIAYTISNRFLPSRPLHKDETKPDTTDKNSPKAEKADQDQTIKAGKKQADLETKTTKPAEPTNISDFYKKTVDFIKKALKWLIDVLVKLIKFPFIVLGVIFGIIKFCKKCRTFKGKKVQEKYLYSHWKYERKDGQPDLRYKDNPEKQTFKRYFQCENCNHKWTDQVTR